MIPYLSATALLDAATPAGEINSLLTKHKATLKSVAEELVRNETLFKEDIVAIVQRKTIQLEKDNGGRNDEYNVGASI